MLPYGRQSLVQREGNKIALICTMRALSVSLGGYRRVGINSRSARLSSSRYTLPELAPSSEHERLQVDRQLLHDGHLCWRLLLSSHQWLPRLHRAGPSASLDKSTVLGLFS